MRLINNEGARETAAKTVCPLNQCKAHNGSVR